MLLGVVIVIILRYIRSVNYSFIIFIYGLIGSLTSVVLCLLEDVFELPNNFYHWMYAVGVASLAFAGHIFLTLALKYEEAGVVSLIRPIEIIFIFGWQLWFLKALPDWMRYIKVRQQFLIFEFRLGFLAFIVWLELAWYYSGSGLLLHGNGFQLWRMTTVHVGF